MQRINKIVCFLSLLVFSGGGLFAQNNYRVKLHPASKRTANEMAPVMTRDGMVFISDMETGSMIKIKGNDDQMISDIFYAAITDEGKWENEKVYSAELKTTAFDGPISFNFSEDIAVFAQNFEKPVRGRRIENPNSGLFFSTKIDSVWTNIVEFEHNNRDYHTTHPALSPMADLLYFTSDMPGGFGGYDLYVCRNQNGIWSSPENLGPVVNTSDNEIYPSLHASGRLYFSSNGHDRVGGYDIFYTDLFQGRWFSPVKLGSPFNSGLNDFTFYTDENYETGFFTSNRRGSEDIFTFESVLPQFDFCKLQTENNYCYIFFEEGTISMDSTLYMYEWKMGDGTKVRAKESEHCYVGPGDYLVELNVIDILTGIVEFNQAEYLVEVRKIIQPYITSVDTAFVNTEIQIHGVESYLGEKKAGEFYWDFGDGSKAVGATVRHTYLSPGIFTLKLGILEDSNNNEAVQQFCSYKNIVVKE